MFALHTAIYGSDAEYALLLHRMNLEREAAALAWRLYQICFQTEDESYKDRLYAVYARAFKRAQRRRVM